ncbi:hypothetical protein L1889_15830 [Paenalcaligenes niemegkensis]|uniref:hypothetical protein n=1 Tax=Paenalcaligenes niemegkensis TaxID=2895469 RepID=UPI001EE98ECE|nr:hypothetical protein [Paenalcaligenes niemegkensis]MCQ9617955.1 hypothetical protein [Paenalcaligenes niemegkensis]
MTSPPVDKQERRYGRRNAKATVSSVICHGWLSKMVISRPSGSEALQMSSEYDGYATGKWHAALDTVPQSAPKIMTVYSRAAPLRCKSADSDWAGLK